ncbi:hypothetical protein AB0H71_16045 [Nocardia sp. NPDC050697]|uniref:hypothetical protein n=1 Tax=Nocardia sp. NPDC050697 TaxID=3155158 RepID=UPI0033D41237
MVKPDSALRRLWRTTGKLLEPYGFAGAEPRWVRAEPGGVAVVERTRVVRTWTDGQQVISFGLAASAVPDAWRDYVTWRGTAAELPRLPDPHSPWSLRPDPEQPGHALESDLALIRAELPRRVHACARRAIQLTEPERYREELRALPGPEAAAAIVVLLAAVGSGAELDAALRHSDSPEAAAYARARATPGEGRAVIR